MYDNICKFLAETFSTDFASWLLGAPIALTELSPAELSLEPIRADALILLQSEQVVLHLEFQTLPKPDIPFRMIDYRLRVYRRFPQKQMRQVVLYLQQTESDLVQQTTFALEETQHRFQVIRLWEQPTEAFFQTPGLLPFAVLSRASDRVQVLQQVAEAIGQITDRCVQSNVAASTYILAGLTLEREVIKRLLRRDIMQESVTYQEIQEEAMAKGLAEGRAKGHAEGHAEGRAEGRAEGQEQERQAVALKLLQEGIPVDMIARVTELDLEQIQQLQDYPAQ